MAGTRASTHHSPPSSKSGLSSGPLEQQRTPGLAIRPFDNIDKGDKGTTIFCYKKSGIITGTIEGLLGRHPLPSKRILGHPIHRSYGYTVTVIGENTPHSAGTPRTQSHRQSTHNAIVADLVSINF